MPTLHDALRRHTAALIRAGTEQPRLSAELVLAAALGMTRDALLRLRILDPGKELEPAAAARAEELLARRAAGEPTAYILGSKEFYSRDFLVTPATLIPRPETELLVDAALAFAATRKRPGVFADFGAGAGCIAVTLAMELPAWKGYALEICPEALAVARENAQRHHAANVAWIRADFTGPLPFPPGSLDMLAANPPYVSEAEYAGLPLEVRGFEPKGALVSGESGLEYMAPLFDRASVALRPGGLLLIEVGAGQQEAVLGLARSRGRCFTSLAVAPDLAGLPRLFSAIKA